MNIKINQIYKNFVKKKALSQVSFDLFDGEIVGLLGPNGAGKSTLIKSVCGLISIDGGSITFDGENPYVSNNYKRDIGYLPENNPLIDHMYVKEFLGLKTDFYGLGLQRLQQVIDLVGLTSHQEVKIYELSKGYRQRVGIANAILHDPKILILDEPTSGLDPNQMKEIRDLIKTISKNKIVMFSSHILSEVEQICDRVVMIHEGRKVLDQPVSELGKGEHQIEIQFANKQAAHVFSLQNHGFQIIDQDNSRVLIDTSQTHKAEILNWCVRHELEIDQMTNKSSDLNHIFEQLTHEKHAISQ